MTAFYFDVGGVLIPDKFAPSNALKVFRELGRRYSFAPDSAYAAYSRLQPSLDLGATSLADLCAAMDIQQESFERGWLAMHPLDGQVVSVIERLIERGHSVGLATNFCRRLLDLLMGSARALSRLTVCCSSDIGVAKPSREFFDRATRMIGETEIVFVDDRAVNVEAAERFGWTAIQASSGWLSRFQRRYLANAGSAPNISPWSRVFWGGAGS